MYEARKAFVKAESSDKIKRALRHPVRASEEFVENGKYFTNEMTENASMVQVKLLGS